MVRFFAPVAIWINMNSALNQDCAAPPEKFRNLFEFLERQLNSGQPQSNFVAVIANACEQFDYFALFITVSSFR
jgi:hypothetical protein